MKDYAYGGSPGKTKHMFCCCAFCMKGRAISLCGWDSTGKSIEVDYAANCTDCKERAQEGGHFLQ